MTSKAQATKQKKKDELDLIKIKTFVPQRILIKEVKIQTTEWKKIFVNYVSDKGQNT